MATSSARRQRERMLAGVGLVMLLMVLAGAVPALLRQAAVVEYGDGMWQEATPREVCPGEAFTFPVTLTVQEGPAFVRIVESWCRAADGICPRQFSTVDELALLEPVTVRTTARRVAPQDMAAGEWELHHINESHVSGKITVTGYGVRVRVGECGAVNE